MPDPETEASRLMMRSSPMENDNGDGSTPTGGGAVSAGIVGPKCNVGVPVSGLMATLITYPISLARRTRKSQ